MHIMRTAVMSQKAAEVNLHHKKTEADNMASSSVKAVVGRALRETGAALKHASGAEVRLLHIWEGEE